MKHVEEGRFIVFEGLDGSGKSTQCVRLAERLRSLGIVTHETCEPTDGPIGSLIHQIMTGRMAADQRTIAALFAADRLDHLLDAGSGLRGKVTGGVTVLSDRYYFSSFAYHGVHAPMEWVIQVNSQAAEILRPDLTVFLDLPPERCLERLRGDRWRLEMYETLENMRKVREKYFEAFASLEGRETVRVIDAGGPADQVAEAIWAVAKEWFPQASVGSARPGGAQGRRS
jgi:dTMP kinase